MNLSLGPRTPDTVMELSVYNVVAHLARRDMTTAEISAVLTKKWHTRGPLTPSPTERNVRGAARRLEKKQHVNFDNATKMVSVTVRQPPLGRGLPLFLEPPP